jgi:hypothetical protein
MRMMHLTAVLMLVPTLGLPMTAPARAKTSLARAFNSARSPIGSQPQPNRSKGREIIGPFCSSACITDQGPSGCREHVWFYGGSDTFASNQNAIW